MEVAVFGAGAVGLGIGSCLIEAGAEVVFVARPDARHYLETHGLRRTGIFGEVAFAPERFGVVGRMDELDDRRIDFVLVCTKSFDSPAVAEALSAAPACRADSCKIVLFQNGWGNFEVFAARIEPRRVFSARVITGFRLLSPRHVDVTVHADAVKIGSLAGADQREMEPLARRISDGGIPAEVTPTVERDLWAKILYNCCLNPLGAVLEQNYGSLGDAEPTRAIMNAIAEETFAVMRAAGFRTHWDDAAGFLRDFHGQMVPATHAHRSSMLQDLKAGRRTEIDAMSGAAVELGERFGVATPFNRIMRDLVRFKESQAAAR
ncbi:MAG TPA: 2-dehydropantoate 2-reductase [Planctomycetaceae bacterium]|nr:2-dehydropantoate 2-reductase [Planctomycetaceae bacterium]